MQGGGVRGDLLLRYQQYRDPEGPLRIRARGSRYVVLYSVQCTVASLFLISNALELALSAFSCSTID